MEEIAAERRDGNFTSLHDFCIRMCQEKQRTGSALNRRALEGLIRAGAFDSLGGKRSQYLAVYEKTLEGCQSSARSLLLGQLSLLGDDVVTDDLPNIAEFSQQDLLLMEKEAIGIFISGHPLDKYRDILSKSNTESIADVTASESEEERKVTVTGIITKIKQKTTKKDELMAFLTIEDLSGIIEVLIFPKTYRQYEKIIKEEKILKINGRLDTKEGELPKIIFESGIEISGVEQKKMYIKIPPDSEDKLPALKEILKIYGGEQPVFLYYPATKVTYAADRGLYVSYSEVLKGKIIKLLGEDADVKEVE